MSFMMGLLLRSEKTLDRGRPELLRFDQIWCWDRGELRLLSATELRVSWSGSRSLRLSGVPMPELWLPESGLQSQS